MNIKEINDKIQDERNALLNHSLYKKIKTVNDLQKFLEVHVFAVWDFMSLLKALQQKLTCTTVPWFASENPELRYLINEIVLAEESDLAIDGTRQSHFEMYLDAMKASDADTSNILNFIEELKKGDSIFEVIEKSKLHPNIKSFLNFSFNIIARGKKHEIAAAFTFGRENLIPDMFSEILKNFQSNFPETDLSKLIYYFERHIELDQDEHGPMAFNMVTYLCENNEEFWNEVLNISKEALKERYLLWNAIEETLE